MSSTAFTFTKIVVADTERASAFYRDAIGLAPVGRVTDDRHDEVIMAGPGNERGPLLMLVRHFDRPTPPAGSAWTGFSVTDLAATIAAVEAHGGSVVAPPQDVPEYKLTIAVVADPEGHPIELTAPMH